MRRLDVWSNGRKGGIIVSSRITGCALCTRVSVTGSTKVGIWKRCRILRPYQRKSRSDVGGSNATLVGLRRIERFNSPKTAPSKLLSCIPSLAIIIFPHCTARRSYLSVPSDIATRFIFHFVRYDTTKNTRYNGSYFHRDFQAPPTQEWHHARETSFVHTTNTWSRR